MTFDIYKIDSEKINKGSIKAVLNESLEYNLDMAMKGLKNRKIKIKDLCKTLQIHPCTFWKYLRKTKEIPLTALKELSRITRINFQQDIIYLAYGQNSQKIQIPKKLSKDLAKLVGALAADGHMKIRKTSRGIRYEIIIRECFKSNMDCFGQWFKKSFGFEAKLQDGRNHYFIYLSNKILVNFFHNVMELPLGKKTTTISTPALIKNAHLVIKLAFTKGVYMFDGGVDYRTGYINLMLKSKSLIAETIQFLRQFGLEPDYICMRPDKFSRFKIRFRKKLKLKKCLILFEKRSEKWFRLHEHLYGLQGRTKDLNTALESFNQVYPRVRKSAITITDVMLAVGNSKKGVNFNTVSQNLKRSKTVTYEYLKKLEVWGVLTSKKQGTTKRWNLNSTIPIPRRKQKMAEKMVDQITGIMKNSKNIRNLAIAAHID